MNIKYLTAAAVIAMFVGETIASSYPNPANYSETAGNKAIMHQKADSTRGGKKQITRRNVFSKHLTKALKSDVTLTDLNAEIIIPPVVISPNREKDLTTLTLEESENIDPMDEDLLTSQITSIPTDPSGDAMIFTQKEKTGLTITPPHQVINADGSVSFLSSDELSINSGEFTVTAFNSLYRNGINTVTIGENATIGQDGAKVLAEALMDGRITHLALLGTITDTIARDCLTNAITSSKKIRRLSWRSSSMPVNELVEVIAEALQNNTNLTDISLYDITITPDDMQELIEVLRENKTLENLAFINVAGIEKAEKEKLREIEPRLKFF